MKNEKKNKVSLMCVRADARGRVRATYAQDSVQETNAPHERLLSVQCSTVGINFVKGMK
jgi:hypothetical protein